MHGNQTALHLSLRQVFHCLTFYSPITYHTVQFCYKTAVQKDF
jgi:hypothetical protein